MSILKKLRNLFGGQVEESSGRASEPLSVMENIDSTVMIQLLQDLSLLSDLFNLGLVQSLTARYLQVSFRFYHEGRPNEHIEFFNRWIEQGALPVDYRKDLFELFQQIDIGNRQLVESLSQRRWENLQMWIHA